MGGNVALGTTSVRATLRWTTGPDATDLNVSALLLTGSGVVGSEADFVFYNQPEHPSGAVRLSGRTSGARSADAVDVDLARVPALTDRVVLVASATGGTLGQVQDLVLEIADTADTAGPVLASFAMQAGAETAFLCGEVYRRGGDWKFRAVGQGYVAGLAGLAQDFGIDVGQPEPASEAPPAPAPHAPAPAPSAPPAPAPAPPAPAPPAQAAPPPPPGVRTGRSPLDLDTPWPPG